MTNTITARKLGQWCQGIALIGLALAATGVSGYLNVSYGLQFSLVIAVVFGLSDTALFLIPAAAATNGWSRYLRAAFLACALTSVWTAANALFDGQWQHFVTVEHKAGQQNDLKDEIERLKNSLASIDEQAGVKALEKLLGNTTDARMDECSEEAGGRGPECRKLEARERNYTARLALAKRRDKLESKLASARSTLKNAKPVSSAGATEIRSIITTILALLLLETLRHFNMEGLRLIRLAMRKTRKKKQEPAAPKPTPAPAQGTVIPLPEQRARNGLRSIVGN